MSDVATQPTAGPIFVMGAQGSGTTVMRLILDSHENIAMAQETGFARLLVANEWVPFAGEVTARWYRQIGLSKDELERELAAFYGGLFTTFAQRRGANRWGDKTPSHVWHMDLLARVFPDAVFIGMIRHPGAGASSRTRRMGHSWSSSVTHWVRRNTEMLGRAAELGDRFVLCRYEDLVTRPEPVLRELFGWLGESWSDRLLAFHEVHRERGTPRQVEGWTHSDEPLDTSRVGAWTEGMTAQRWERLDKPAVRELARVTGYRIDVAIPEPWEEDTQLLSGTRLRERMAEAGGIDWSKRARPSLPNRPLTLRDLNEVKRRAARRAAPPGLSEQVVARVQQVGGRVLHLLPVPLRRPARTAWWKVRSRLGRRG